MAAGTVGGAVGLLAYGVGGLVLLRRQPDVRRGVRVLRIIGYVAAMIGGLLLSVPAVYCTFQAVSTSVGVAKNRAEELESRRTRGPEVPPPHFAIVVLGKKVLTDENLVGYDWATHTFALRKGDTLDTEWIRDSLVWGAPFTVTADGVTCYRGEFTTSLSSISQSCPVIVVDPVGRDRPAWPDTESTVLSIDLGYPAPSCFEGKDPRGDERVRAALRAAGKLRE